MRFEDFKNLFRNVPLAEHNTYGIGGKADILVEVSTKDELKDAIYLANYNHIPYYILGGGTNVLISDNGFLGIVIKNKILEMIFDKEKNQVFAGSGVPMGALINRAKKEGLSGLEWAAGLPGTLGGAIFGNAGSCGSSISESIDFVEVLDVVDLSFKIILKDQCGFMYRESTFKNSGYIIVGAMLKLKKDDPVSIMNKMAENFLFRKKYQPLSSKSEGCVFKNIELSQKENLPIKIWKEIPEFSVFVKKGMIPAGFLIDRAGLKGFRIGNAMVSERHANFIVNLGNASAKDIHKLINEIKNKVFKKFGVELEEEVRFVGF
jgi:UDP-N-acetylmuramate dehydrogenase